MERKLRLTLSEQYELNKRLINDFNENKNIIEQLEFHIDTNIKNMAQIKIQTDTTSARIDDLRALISKSYDCLNLDLNEKIQKLKIYIDKKGEETNNKKKI